MICGCCTLFCWIIFGYCTLGVVPRGGLTWFEVAPNLVPNLGSSAFVSLFPSVFSEICVFLPPVLVREPFNSIDLNDFWPYSLASDSTVWLIVCVFMLGFDDLFESTLVLFRELAPPSSECEDACNFDFVKLFDFCRDSLFSKLFLEVDVCFLAVIAVWPCLALSFAGKEFYEWDWRIAALAPLWPYAWALEVFPDPVLSNVMFRQLIADCEPARPRPTLFSLCLSRWMQVWSSGDKLESPCASRSLVGESSSLS